VGYTQLSACKAEETLTNWEIAGLNRIDWNEPNAAHVGIWELAGSACSEKPD
jgi:hypothetical protein